VQSNSLDPLPQERGQIDGRIKQNSAYCLLGHKNTPRHGGVYFFYLRDFEICGILAAAHLLEDEMKKRVAIYPGTDEKYKARILGSCQRLNNKDNAAAALACDAIVARYREPHRAYHTPRHINDCLNELETVRSRLYNPIAVELALLCHDAIYSAAATDNEEQSAEFAKEIAKMLGLPKLFGEQTAKMIMATKHNIPPPDFDTQAVTDMDLASLGYSETEFDKNTRRIRREYTRGGLITAEQFDKGRANFLKKFLPPNRPSIYLTYFFREKYEAQARQNLARAIKQLSE